MSFISLRELVSFDTFALLIFSVRNLWQHLAHPHAHACLNIELCQLKKGYSSPTSTGTPPFLLVIVINNLFVQLTKLPLN